MARPRTDAWYVRQVGPLVEEGLGAPQIAARLEARAREARRKDVPSPRTVARLVKEYRDLPEEVRREQRRFRWPESMQAGALPWEAGQAALELLRFCDQAGAERPTCRHVKWFWRLRLAAPTLPTPDAARFATVLAYDEYGQASGDGGSAEVPGLDYLLAYVPWQGPEARAAYELAAKRAGATLTRAVYFDAGENLERLRRDMEALSNLEGSTLAEDLARRVPSDRVRDALRGLGLSEEEVDDLVGRVILIPPQTGREEGKANG